MILVPRPKKLEIFDKTFKLKGGYAFLGRSAKKLGKFIREFLDLELSAFDGRGTVAKFYVDPAQVPFEEGYFLSVDDGGIKVIGHDVAGLYYGIRTLEQIIAQFGDEIPHLRIEDHPDFRNRGVMLDISRDKVPKLETLKMIIDTLSRFKINHFELYMEHTFAYRDHEKVWKEYSPMTGEEIMELDEFAKERFVELVPNQNSFGHMSKWLVHDEYKHLAEAPEGFETPWGDRWKIPFSLSPAVEETLKFLESLYDELLPHFSSDKFNVGCDETFDLCQGKSKELCEKYGKGRVYLDFLLKIHSLVKKRGKTMLFWGDIIKNYPELVGKLPDGIVALIWGYEKDHPFEKECEIFSKSGVPFYVCPGTSTWNSIVGRYDNMKENIKNAALNGKRWGAIGVLNTDWGDNGHWQHLPFSFPGWIWGSALSWNVEEVDLEKALDLFVFKDESETIGKILKDLGNVYKETGVETFNSSVLALVLIYPDRVSKENKYFSKLKPENLEKARNTIISSLEKLQKIDMKRKDADLIKKEIENGAKLALYSVDLLKELLKTPDGRIKSIPEERKRELAKELKDLSKEYEKIWLERNKPGGLKFSLEKLQKVLKFY